MDNTTANKNAKIQMFPFKKYQEKWKNLILPKKSGKDIYILEMWPYPSGDLHMGHVRNYTIGDIVARLRYLQGYSVFHPMGWDAHGLPAENAAKEHNIHPKIWTEKNINNMRHQLKSLFFSYDWDYEMATCDSAYYKFQQQLFIAMFKAGFIKKKESYVNWDPVDQTVLANEQVIDGKGWRSGAPIQKKLLSQWFCTISDFSNVLLEDLDQLEGHWPKQILTMQRNWIGKDTGYGITFHVEENKENSILEIFTKSPYYVPKVEFVAVAPDSEYGVYLYKKYSHIQEFIKNNPRDDKNQDTNGFFTGFYVINPFNQKKIPLYIGNYVLGDYGTGAVMGVPSVCENDHNFAIAHNIKIEYPIKIQDYLSQDTDDDKKLTKELLDKKIVYIKTVYKIKDWCISRQRYWGAPIPIIYCDYCGILPNEDLPVHVSSDMNNINYYIKCPKCGKDAKRESDTMDTFFDSSFYFWLFPLFPEIKKNDKIFIKDLKRYPVVDLYIGGPEHAVLHLLFARFFGKVLKILGYIDESEPFKNLYTQGMICLQTYKNKITNKFIYPKDVFEENGVFYTLNNNEKQEVIVGNYEKMSKSKKNVISPEEIINQYGVDALRLFIVSDTPCDKDLQWNDKALNGCWCFNNKIWDLTNKIHGYESIDNTKDIFFQEYSWNVFFKIIKYLEDIHINVAIAQIRVLVNYIEDNKSHISKDLLITQWKDLLKLYWCLCPVISTECLSILEDDLKFILPFAREKTQGDVYELVVQKNGKKITSLEVLSNFEEKEIIALILEKYSFLKSYNKVIFVKYKVINFVFSIE